MHFDTGQPMASPERWNTTASTEKSKIVKNCRLYRICGEEYKLRSSLLCSFLHFPVTFPLLGKNILLSTLFTNTLTLYSSQGWETNFTPIQNNK